MGRGIRAGSLLSGLNIWPGGFLPNAVIHAVTHLEGLPRRLEV